MLTLKDFNKSEELSPAGLDEKIYIAEFGDYTIEIIIVEPIDEKKRLLLVALRNKGRIFRSEERRLEHNGELKRGQINEILLKGLSIANKFYKDFIA